jgi:hypothetical protein
MTDVPVVVTDEAAAYIAQVSMQQELEQMLDWIRQHVIPLEGIRVILDRRLYEKLPPHVYIRAYQGRANENTPLDLVQFDWGHWKVHTFPGNVCTTFSMSPRYLPFSESA